MNNRLSDGSSSATSAATTAAVTATNSATKNKHKIFLIVILLSALVNIQLHRSQNNHFVNDDDGNAILPPSVVAFLSSSSSSLSASMIAPPASKKSGSSTEAGAAATNRKKTSAVPTEQRKKQDEQKQTRPAVEQTRTFDEIGKQCGVLISRTGEEEEENGIVQNGERQQSLLSSCGERLGRTWGEFKAKQSQRQEQEEHQSSSSPSPPITITKECLPRLVALSSFQTGGNGIARMLWSLRTGLLSGGSGGPANKAGRIFPWEENTRGTFFTGPKPDPLKGRQSADIPCPAIDDNDRDDLNGTATTTDNDGIDIDIDIDPMDYLSIPYTKANVGLQKFHNAGGIKKLRKGPSHCIQLIRNPGDHLLRNQNRWKTETRMNPNDLDAFVDSVKNNTQMCRKIANNGYKAWVSHYRSWHTFCTTPNAKTTAAATADTNDNNNNNYDSPIPSPRRMTLKYEHITNLTTVSKTMNDLLVFVDYELFGGDTVVGGRNNRNNYVVNYTAVVREPKYVHGTLFKEACGIELARKLHENTKDLATDPSFGYQFDYDEGTWIIPPYTTPS